MKAKKATKKPAKKPVKKVAPKASKAPVKKIAKSAPKKPAKKIAKVAAKKLVKKPVKKVSKPVVKKAAKKPAKALVKKTAVKKTIKKASIARAPKKLAAKKPAKTVAKKAPVKKPVAKNSVAKKAAKKIAAKPITQKIVVAPPKPYAGPPWPLMEAILSALDDAKAESVLAINVEGRSSVADGMVIATGRVNRHVAAIADQLVEKLKAHGQRDIRVEGLEQGDWVLVDAGNVIVHIFRPEVRAFYNLEKLWSEHAPLEKHEE